MGGTIGFADDPARICLKPNWVYRRFLTDVMNQHPDDPPFLKRVEEAIIFQNLSVDEVWARDAELGEKILHAMRDVARATLGEMELPNLKWREGLGEEWQDAYQGAIKDILDLINRELDSSEPWGQRGGQI